MSSRGAPDTASSPATVKDFTTWSSLTVADARAALDRIGDGLGREDHDGTTWYADPSPAVMSLACANLLELDLTSEPLGPSTLVRTRT